MTNKELFSTAWDLARQGAARFGGRASDYFRESLRITRVRDRIIVPPGDLPVWSYKGMIKKHMYYLADHSGSGTFYIINRGLGRAAWDGLDPGKYLSGWEDGTDYTIDGVMDGANMVTGALPSGSEYVTEIHKVVWSDEYNIFINNGGDPKDLV